MKVGVLLVFQNWHENLSDEEMFLSEIRLGEMAETLGYDSVWSVEHHFDDYSMCPDATQSLSYLAGRTNSIKLGTGAVILPWNDPLRVVEKAAMLDAVSEGRMVLGMGRGAARREFTGFRKELADSRELFDEAALIIMNGLETGFVEADTKHFKQPRVEVRPRPTGWTRDRMVMVSMSPSSAEVAADYGLKALRFSQGEWEASMPEINTYRSTFEAKHGKRAPPFIISDFIVCHEDPAKVAQHTDSYFAAQFQQVASHYEWGGEHFKSLPSYSTYVTLGDMTEAAGGPTKAYKGFIDGNLIGTPERMLEKHAMRTAMVGEYDMLANFSFGGMPFEEVYRQMKLFADKVMPHMKG